MAPSFQALFDPLALHQEFKSFGAGARVAVLDTGIDLKNASLTKQVVAVRDLCNPGVGDGMDADGHGTQLAGVICALAPACELVVGKIMARGGFFTYSAFCDGVRWARGKGAQIICVASGEKREDGEAAQLVLDIYENQNSILVSAVGNDASNSKQAGCFPARWPSTLAVGSINQHLEIADFSAQNPDVPIIYAPGVDMIAPDLNGPVVTSGTSLSAAYVAGLLALLYSVRNHAPFMARQVRNRIFQTAYRAPNSQNSFPIIHPQALLRD